MKPDSKIISKLKLVVPIVVTCAIILFVLLIIWVHKERLHLRDNYFNDFNIINESPMGYTPAIYATKDIQLGKNYIFFAGSQNGIFKYHFTTGEISEYCTDPICKHYGSSSTCRIANFWKGNFFRAFSDGIVYTAPLDTDQNSQLTKHLFCFNSDTMTNTLLDSSVNSANMYCVSEKYIYFTNVVTKDGKSYYNHKQVDLSSGKVKVFGEETEGVTPYNLIGAIGGCLYATDTERTVTYICSEDKPGEFTKFWDKPIVNLWAGENDLFFKSRAPDDDTPKEEAKYFFYHTDKDGKIIAKHELVGGMRWCSIYDGRYLYYIPDEDVYVTNLDGGSIKIHSRELYRLDMETGKREIAFTFDGDYATMALKFSFGNDVIVYGNKIYTAHIGEATSMRDPQTGELIYGGKSINCTDGIAIIDMSNGDITYVTANYSRRGGEMTSNVEHIPMDIKGE